MRKLETWKKLLAIALISLGTAVLISASDEEQKLHKNYIPFNED